MSEIVDAAVKALRERLGEAGLDGSVRFVIEDEGAIRIDESGGRGRRRRGGLHHTVGAETFRALLDGELDPTAAFMSGKLSIDGDMGLAMKLGRLLG